MISSTSGSPMMPPPTAIPSISTQQRQFIPSIPLDTSVRLTKGPPPPPPVVLPVPPPNPPYSIKVVSTSSSSKPKRAYNKHAKPTAADIAAATVVQLDHSYCQERSVELPPPPSPAPRKLVKTTKEEPSSRFKPIKYLLHRDENNDIGVHAVTKTGSPKLEHLLKRTSMYEGPSALPHSTSPRKMYNYYREEENIDVDVVTLSPDPELHCDLDKARNAMNECETYVNFLRTEEVDDNWEDQIVKTGWTKVQRNLFNTVMKALHSEHFARLANEGNPGEVILRRNSLDLTSHRVRKALVNILWDGKLSQWLHGVLIDNLSHHYLAIYLDVLQTLRAKAPALVDRMIVLSTVVPKQHSTDPGPSAIEKSASGSHSSAKPQEQRGEQSISSEAISLLMKKQWDPFSSVIHHKGIKLKCTPVFLFVPAGPSWGHAVNIRRHKNFVNLLNNLGKVIAVTMPSEVSTCTNLSVDELAEKMILTSKLKLAELKNQFPERSIYLVGWGTGSIIAATVSLTEQVAGVICLGFPIFGIAGSHGEGSDPLLQMKHPVLFVIGDRATNCTIPIMEEFREDLSNLQHHAYIVAIKCADEYLRIGRYHRKHLLVTQSYVDKCIVDEIGIFVNDSYEANVKSSVSMLPPILIKNEYSMAEFPSTSTAKRRVSLNGTESMEFEGLGLTLANLPNGHDRSSDESNPKKGRRKSYHKKSQSNEYGSPQNSSRKSSIDGFRPLSSNDQQTSSSNSEQRDQGGRRYSSDSSSSNGNNYHQIQNPYASVPFPPFGSAYPGMPGSFMAGASALFGSYPFFPGAEAATAYSAAAYAHVANQAAAIQHAIAMETVEGYNQYYSQLEKYKAQYVQHYESLQQGKVKKPRKPREAKPKAEKPPRKPRRTKAEKAAEAAALALEQAESSSNEAPSCSTALDCSTSSAGQSQRRDEGCIGSKTIPEYSKPSTSATQAQMLAAASASLPWISMTRLTLPPKPNTPLPPPSTTMAALVLASSSSIVSTSSMSIQRSSGGHVSTSEIYAIKSQPPGFEKPASENSSNLIKIESALRSPPLLIPTQKSPNQNRIPIRLCLQKDSNGDGGMQESIEASLVPLPVDDPHDETSDLPPLVPVRSQKKLIHETAGIAPPCVEVKSKDDDKISNEIAVENAKNLQVKIPRLSIHSKSRRSSSLSSNSPSPPVEKMAASSIVPTVPYVPPKPLSSTGSDSSLPASKLRHRSSGSRAESPALGSASGSKGRNQEELVRAVSPILGSKTRLRHNSTSSSTSLTRQDSGKIVVKVEQGSPGSKVKTTVAKSSSKTLSLKKTTLNRTEEPKTYTQPEIDSEDESSENEGEEELPEPTPKPIREPKKSRVSSDEDYSPNSPPAKRLKRHEDEDYAPPPAPVPAKRSKRIDDEDYLPVSSPPAIRTKRVEQRLKRTSGDEGHKEVKKGKSRDVKEIVKIREDSVEIDTRNTRRTTKRKLRAAKITEVRVSSDEDEADEIRPKKTPGKQSSRIESSEEESEAEILRTSSNNSKSSSSKSKSRSRRSPSFDTSEEELLILKKKRKIIESDQEIEPKQLRNRKSNQEPEDTARRTRRNSKRQNYSTYVEVSSAEEAADSDDTAVTLPAVKKQRSAISKPSTSSISAENKRNTRRSSGGTVSDEKRQRPNSPSVSAPTKTAQTGRMVVKRKPRKSESQVIEIDLEDSPDEDEDDRRVTRSGSTPVARRHSQSKASF